MKQPRFPLVSILELRETAKKRAEDALALAIRDRQAVEECCVIARAELAALAERLGGNQFAAHTQVNGWRALVHQEQTCKELETQLRDADQKVDTSRGLLIGASRDHELVLKLRGKWAKAKEKEEVKTAELALDDFVNARTAARQSAEVRHA